MTALRSQHHRVEFRLSMPGRSSWNGGWSGEGRNYSLVHELVGDQIVKLFDLAPEHVDFSMCRNRWTHRWSDGWVAEVSARVVPANEELPESNGFHGYGWMVDNILATGSPYSKGTS